MIRATANRRDLAAGLRQRQAEIEQATLTRIYSVSGPDEARDPEYRDGLRTAVSAAVAYGIEAVQRSEDRPAPIPTALLSQARLAARHGVGLETVLRRYVAGYTLLGDFIIEEVERSGPPSGATLKRLLRSQAALLDRLIAAVSDEFAREAKAHPSTAEGRRVELIQRLLAGELVDAAEIAYRFDHYHLGLLAIGSAAAQAIRDLASTLDRRVLTVPRGEETFWAWLGGRNQIDTTDFETAISSNWPASTYLAVGEPAQGLVGWRLTHRQARAALLVARRTSEKLVRYSDVALEASILQDDLLVASLNQTYLAPLAKERDGGQALRETLRAYFSAQRNVSSTAAALGVTRQTVTSRIRTVERLLGRNLNSCAAELDAALRIDGPHNTCAGAA